MRYTIWRAILLNLALIAAATAIFGPLFSQRNGSSLSYGFIRGGIVYLPSRAPGVLFELYVIRRTSSEGIIAAHLISAAFALLLALLSLFNGLSDIPFSIWIYFICASIGTGIAALIVFATDEPNKLASRVPSSAGSRSTTNGSMRSEPRRLRARGMAGVSRAVAFVLAHRPTLAGIGAAVGIIASIAGLVQGFNAQDLFRSVLALVIGCVGLLTAYLLTLRRPS